MSDKNELPYIWTIVERFYRTYHLYERQYESYERMVSEYVAREGKPRHEIRLDAVELSGLLDFKQLEDIRDYHVERLKGACHALFRRDNSTDLLDRLVNDIFHELSILKEEHYNVLTYELNPSDAEDLEEQTTIINEVHEMFPIKVHRLKHLFARAIGRVERLLPRYRDNTMLIRSLFLHRAGFVAQAYPAGLTDFYRIMYGEDKVIEGYVTVGCSFFEAGFYEHAIECFEAGEDYLHSVPPHEKRRLDPGWKRARELFKRHKRLGRERLVELSES